MLPDGDCARDSLTLISNAQVLVRFFDTGDYSWVPRNKVCNYRFGSTAPDAGQAAIKDQSYLTAVDEAQQYLSN